MRTPKRFKLDKAAAPKVGVDELPLAAIYYRDGALWATDGRAIARVPLLKAPERPGAELPRLERGEEPPQGPVPPRAWAEATKGKTGEGRLVATPTGHEGQSDEGKPWVRSERPDGALDDAMWQELEGAVQAAQEPPSGDGRAVELSIDAEALVALSRALGGDGGVRLRFVVGPDGRPDAGRGQVLVQPVDRRGKDEPMGIIMAVLGGA